MSNKEYRMSNIEVLKTHSELKQRQYENLQKNVH
jgi:hypothetical protein